MMFIAIKTEDGAIKGKLSFYCRMLGVSRQGFYKYLAHKDRPWKYQDLADAIRAIHTEDEYNDTYGRIRMYQALLLKKPEGLKIPSERTVYRVMDEIGLSHRPKRKPNGITKADREARKSEDLLKRDFKSDKPIALGVYGLSSDTHIDMLYARLQLPFQALHDAGDTLHGLVYVIDHAVSNALFGIFADHGKHGYAPIRLLLSCDTLDSC